ncbi:transposase [Sulfobacillus acidophilus]|uniref:Transposase n=1 Tax=Sulfobacillus acidophilus TaxID=53633 RepID=A0ABS3AW65_9FIRM|nr:transposase [Sulfobacillus acidophilus]
MICFVKTILTQKNRLKLKGESLKMLQLLAYHTARLYNVGLYEVRQHYFEHKKYLSYAKSYHICKTNENYALLLSDTAQQVLRLVDRNFKSFFGLLKAKKQGKYDNKVKIPKYKNKEETWIIPVQGRSVRLKNGRAIIGLSKAFCEKYQPSIKKLEFPLPKNIQAKKLQEIRILPVARGFEIEYVYQKEVQPKKLNEAKHLSIDLGLNNLASCFDSTSGSSFAIDGRYIKAINQRYNKETARLKSIKDQQKYRHSTRRMTRLCEKRKWRINDYFNRSVKKITDYCVANDIGTLVMGDFKTIKQNSNMGKRNNQNFVQIPYDLLKRKLKGKCEQLGIGFSLNEESYTSKCSFLDKEAIQKHEKYQGRRIKRGLFRTNNRILVNADINGSANILQKYLTSKHRQEELFFERVCKGFVNNPVRVKLSDMLFSSSKAPSIARVSPA